MLETIIVGSAPEIARLASNLHASVDENSTFNKCC